MIVPPNGVPAPVPAAPAPAPPPPPSPLDAEYFNTVNRSQFDTNQQINQYAQDSAYDKIALAQALQQLADQQPVLQQNATTSANAQGLLYSGALGRQIGDIQSDYLRNQGEQNQAYGQRESQRQSAISSLRQQQEFDRIAAELAAIERASGRAVDAPLIDTTPPALAAALAPKTGAVPKGRVAQQNAAAAARARAQAAEAQARARAQQQNAKKKGRR